MRIIALLLWALILGGCSSLQSPGDYKSLPHDLSVEGKGETPPPIEIKEEGDIQAVLPTHKRKVPPKVGLFLGPGLYHSLAYVEILKAFEKNHISISLISGSEMGLYMAALYAKYGKSSMVEWKLFHLLQYIDKESSVYQDDWVNFLDQLFAKEFGQNSIQKLKIPLIVPVYNVQKKKIEIWDRGPLYPQLRSILFLDGKSNREKMSAFVHQSYFVHNMQNAGVQLIFILDAFPSRPQLVTDDADVKSVYLHSAKRMERERRSLPHYYKISVKGSSLDSLENLPSYQSKVSREMVSVIKKIKHIVEEHSLR